MDKLKIYVESQVSHVGQIITGALMLKNQGYDIEIVDLHETESNYFPSSYPLVRAEYRGQRILYDLWDGYNIYPDINKLLPHYDFYFRRSYSPEKNKELIQGYEGKMYPLGLYFRVTHKDSPLREPRWKELLKTLMGKAPMSYFVPKVFEGVPQQDTGRPPRILFMTQLWNDHVPDFSDEENAERTYINQMRINIIRTLRQRYPDTFIGGLNDCALSRSWAPDLIMPQKFTERRRYLELMHSCDICIGSMGLFESIGGKTGEYVAAAKAIVNERLHFTVTGDFQEGKHYLSFETVEQCLDAVGRLVEDPQLRLEMMHANAEYYQKYLRPDVLVKNTLELIDRKLDQT